MPLLVSTFANSACRSLYNKKTIAAVLKFLGALAAPFFPALCETLWFYNASAPSYIVPCTVFCVLAATLHVILRELAPALPQEEEEVFPDTSPNMSVYDW